MSVTAAQLVRLNDSCPDLIEHLRQMREPMAANAERWGANQRTHTTSTPVLAEGRLRLATFWLFTEGLN